MSVFNSIKSIFKKGVEEREAEPAPALGDESAWGDKGLALHNLGMHEEAIECYALEINPKKDYA